MKRQLNFQTLQCGRGLAALAVVLFHANLTLGLSKYLGRETAPIFECGFNGVYYFFVLSGTVMALAHWDQLGRNQSPWAFYIKRFNRIYLPLWAVLLLVSSALIARVSATDFLLAFSALPAASEPVLAVEWTLRHEIQFYVLFGALLWRPFWGGALIAAWLAGSFFASSLTFPFSFIFSPLHWLFVTGIMGAVAIRKGVPYPEALAIAGATTLVFAISSQTIGVNVFSIPLVAWYGLGSILLITGFARLEITRNLLTPAPLRSLGDVSYSLYLVHFPLVSICAKVATMVESKIHLPVAIYFLLTVAVAVVGGFFFYRLAEKPLTNWARRQKAVPASG